MRLMRLFVLFCCTCSAFAASNLDFLQQLTLLPGASGFEKPVREAVRARWQKTLPKVHVDGMGNVIGEAASETGPRVLLMAHMDEVGLMVESITPDGFLRVVPLGGIYEASVFAHRWQIEVPGGRVTAYSGMDSPHLLTDAERPRTPRETALFLDIGARSAEEVQAMGVRVGLPVTPLALWSPLTANRILAKALDDRIGLAVITDVLETLGKHPNHVIAAATVQEEIGLRGAGTIHAGTRPDVVINIEVGIADDYPKLLAARKGRIVLGKGPGLFAYDRSLIPNTALLEWIYAEARKQGIPVQIEVESGYGEDGAKLQTSGEGVPVINIGVPVRYAHQEGGIFDTRDYENTVKLVQQIVKHLDVNVVAKIRE